MFMLTFLSFGCCYLKSQQKENLCSSLTGGVSKNQERKGNVICRKCSVSDGAVQCTSKVSKIRPQLHDYLSISFSGVGKAQ